MKSFSKRVASFAMAAAMVFSLVAVSPADAEAASKYSLSKKSSITAGKTYTYKVKGVSKNQYIKVKMSSGVTVKYGSKKVKYNSTKITGGKTLALKVKAADKVANYKATLKAIVYNKKTNKRVKGLTTTTKVKCTKLAIKSVEPATLAGSNKYILVTFNKALDSLDPSEVIIRCKDTNELVTVEKVALASNKKSATLTLLGDRQTSGETFVTANVDYVLTVDKAGASASMDFTFPDVWANVVVVATDAAKRTITVGGTKFTVPTTINVDFQEILGRTVTFWFDKNNDITKLNVAKETVVYGAFASKYENGVYTLSSKTSDDKYTTVSGNTAYNGTIYNTTRIPIGNSVLPNDGNVAYAKLVLNPNGTIRTILYEQNMPNRILVASVAGNVVTQSKTDSANLKDYTIVKDGKTIAITDIQAGDVVFYNPSHKFAEVYNSTVVGPVANVTDAKVTVAGKDYEYITDTYGVKYVENNETKTALGKDYFAALKKAGKDATLYLDRFGKVVYASGDQGTVATTTRDIVITGDTKTYTAALESYIRLSGSDATTTAVPEIKLSDLKTVKVTTGGTTTTYTKDTVTGTTKVKSFDEFNPVSTSDSKLLNIKATKSTSADGAKDITITTSPVIGNIVTLTLDSTNSKVIGIEVSTNITTVSNNAAFEKGKSTITGANDSNYQIVSSTPVYEINKDSAVSKVTYGEYAKKTDKTKYTSVLVYADGGNVTKVVINNKANNVYDENQDTKVTGVVTARDTLDSKVVSLTIVSEGKEMTFADFTDNVKDNQTGNAVSGNVVTVTYGKDSNKVSDISTALATTTVSYGSKPAATAGVANGKIAGKELSTSIAPTILVKDGSSWKVVTYGELSDLAATTDYASKQLVIKYHEMATGIIDYAVVVVQ